MTLADLVITLFLGLLWTVVSFYGWLPVLENENTDMTPDGKLIYAPVTLLLDFREALNRVYE